MIKTTHTHTYAVLEISAAAFAGVRTRLTQAGAQGDYLAKDDDDAELIVFGDVALKAAEAKPTVLGHVPVYDGPELSPVLRQALNQPPWMRCDDARCTPEHEILGILIGFGIVLAARGAVIDQLTIQQAMAEIKNLILLCGGKVAESPKTNLQEGSKPGKLAVVCTECGTACDSPELLIGESYICERCKTTADELPGEAP